jgi:cytoskeletal protein RodZ
MLAEETKTGLVFRFGEWVKEQRLGVGMSLREASSRTAMSLHRLSSIENGIFEIQLNSIEVNSLCRTYRITPDEFVKKANGQ